MVVECLFEGVCQFCGQEKKRFPSLDEQELHPPTDLYCCNEYREYIDNVIVTNSVGEALSGHNKKDRAGRRKKKRKFPSNGASGLTGSEEDNAEEEVSAEEAGNGEGDRQGKVDGSKIMREGRHRRRRKGGERNRHNHFQEIPELSTVHCKLSCLYISIKIKLKQYGSL